MNQEGNSECMMYHENCKFILLIVILFQVENFTVSFSDGRALCYLVHHYHPSLLKIEDVCTNTTLTYDEKPSVHLGTPGSSSDDSFTSYWTTTFSASK